MWRRFLAARNLGALFLILPQSGITAHCDVLLCTLLRTWPSPTTRYSSRICPFSSRAALQYYVTTTLRNYNGGLDRWELVGADAGSGLQNTGTAHKEGTRFYDIGSDRFSW